MWLFLKRWSLNYKRQYYWYGRIAFLRRLLPSHWVANERKFFKQSLLSVSNIHAQCVVHRILAGNASFICVFNKPQNLCGCYRLTCTDVRADVFQFEVSTPGHTHTALLEWAWTYFSTRNSEPGTSCWHSSFS